MTEALQAIIEKAWDERDGITIGTGGEVRAAVVEALGLLDSGQRRVAEKVDGSWQVNQWLKKAVLLSLPPQRYGDYPGGRAGRIGGTKFRPNLPAGVKTVSRRGFRAVPGSIVRHRAHIGKGVVLMPSFVNLRLMLVTVWSTRATVGSCAQSANVHLSGGVGIGGVLGRCRLGL
jgi:2,3,4,5-tetrahydropyridine-2-carboxylate N-succinyltransferase